MEQNGTGCQAHEAPILCANNCGFFGTAATMNMCSKCYKDLMLKEENEKIAASSIGSILNGNSNTIVKKSDVIADVDGSSNTTVKKSDVLADVDSKSGQLEPQVLSTPTSSASPLNETEKPKEGSTRCNTCRKRVGLTGFRCRCGDLFCSAHRYSDKHECPYDYRSAAQDAIAKANPVVKAQKLDKI